MQCADVIALQSGLNDSYRVTPEPGVFRQYYVENYSNGQKKTVSVFFERCGACQPS